MAARDKAPVTGDVVVGRGLQEVRAYARPNTSSRWELVPALATGLVMVTHGYWGYVAWSDSTIGWTAMGLMMQVRVNRRG